MRSQTKFGHGRTKFIHSRTNFIHSRTKFGRVVLGRAAPHREPRSERWAADRKRTQERTKAARRRVTGVVFDAGALIALERGDRSLTVLVAEARKGNHRITVPAPCVAQVWRKPSKQARVASFLRLPNVDVIALDDEESRLVGLLLARSRTADIVDAHVALCGHRLGQLVLTSDPGDLRALEPRLKLQRV